MARAAGGRLGAPAPDLDGSRVRAQAPSKPASLGPADGKSIPPSDPAQWRKLPADVLEVLERMCLPPADAPQAGDAPRPSPETIQRLCAAVQVRTDPGTGQTVVRWNLSRISLQDWERDLATATAHCEIPRLAAAHLRGQYQVLIMPPGFFDVPAELLAGVGTLKVLVPRYMEACVGLVGSLPSYGARVPIEIGILPGGCFTPILTDHENIQIAIRDADAANLRREGGVFSLAGTRRNVRVYLIDSRRGVDWDQLARPAPLASFMSPDGERAGLVAPRLERKGEVAHLDQDPQAALTRLVADRRSAPPGGIPKLHAKDLALLDALSDEQIDAFVGGYLAGFRVDVVVSADTIYALYRLVAALRRQDDYIVGWGPQVVPRRVLITLEQGMALHLDSPDPQAGRLVFEILCTSLATVYPRAGDEVEQLCVVNGAYVDYTPAEWMRRVLVATRDPETGELLRVVPAPTRVPPGAPLMGPAWSAPMRAEISENLQVHLLKDLSKIVMEYAHTNPPALEGRKAFLEWAAMDRNIALSLTHMFRQPFEELAASLGSTESVDGWERAIERSGLMDRRSIPAPLEIHCRLPADERSAMARIGERQRLLGPTVLAELGPDMAARGREIHAAGYALQRAAMHFEKAFPDSGDRDGKHAGFRRSSCAPGLRFRFGSGHCTIQAIAIPDIFVTTDFPMQWDMGEAAEPAWSADALIGLPGRAVMNMVPPPTAADQPGGLTFAVDRWVKWAGKCRVSDERVDLDLLFSDCGRDSLEPDDADELTWNGLNCLAAEFLASLSAMSRVVRMPPVVGRRLAWQNSQATVEWLSRALDGRQPGDPVILEMTLPEGGVDLRGLAVPDGSRLRVLNPEVAGEVQLPPTMTLSGGLDSKLAQPPSEPDAPNGARDAALMRWQARVRHAAYKAVFTNELGWPADGIVEVMFITPEFARLSPRDCADIVRDANITRVQKIVVDAEVGALPWDTWIPLLAAFPLAAADEAGADPASGTFDVQLPAPRGDIDLAPLGARHFVFEPWPPTRTPKIRLARGATHSFSPRPAIKLSWDIDQPKLMTFEP